MNNIKLIEFIKKTDIRGTLIPIEGINHVPFDIERFFFIKDLDTHPRGFHSHKITQQVLFPICGSFSVELTDGKTIKTFHLSNDNVGIYVPINIWLKMYNYSQDCIICVICSHKFDETEYIRNYGDFLNYNSSLKNEKISCFDLSVQNELMYPKILSSIKKVLKSNEYVLGKELKTFEHNFSEYIGTKYCIGCSNGTSAMICALKALQLPIGSEIIVQSNTYIAAPLAIEACGHIIKIVDINDNLCMDLNDLESAITDKTKAILIVHLYGRSPNMYKLLQLREKFGLKLIEDCAQSHGSTFDGKHLGTFGDMGCFSFYPSKNLGCIGEGGCVITNDIRYSEYVKKYRNYGGVEKYHWEIKGTNERMHNIQAAVLNVKLPFLSEWNDKRRRLANEYDLLLSKIPQITIPNKESLLVCNYHLYIILIDNREELMKYLEKNKIITAIHYPQTFYKSKAFEEKNKNNIFKADSIKYKILSLPMYPELEIEKVHTITKCIKEFYSGKSNS